MKKTIEIFGSNGEFKIDRATGKVVTPAEKMPDDYMQFIGATFDVAEHFAFWKPHLPPTYTGGAIDILDIGVTCANGTTEPACAQWRQNALDDKVMDSADAFGRFKYRALQYLKSVYCLDENDIDAERLRLDYVAGDKPEESIDAMATRFGLIKLADWTPAKAAAFMHRFAIYR